jgi:uncharacterized protein (TIGR02246 family)
MQNQLGKKLCTQWIQSIEKDAQTVANLYDEKAILLPTIRGDFLRGKKQIENYFKIFCALKPKATLDEIHSQEFTNKELTAFVGHYDFSFAEQPNSKARFSFIFKKIDEAISSKPSLGENYLIIHHHSSLTPS